MPFLLIDEYTGDAIMKKFRSNRLSQKNWRFKSFWAKKFDT